MEEPNRANDVRLAPAYLLKQDKPKGSGHSKESCDPESRQIRLLSWNIDSLDKKNLIIRTSEVCNTILKEDPDVVYLQEVVPQSLEQIQTSCEAYRLIQGAAEGYFTAVLLKSNSCVYQEHEITPYSSSQMARNLLKVKATVKGLPCLLMTSHLESMGPCREERKLQLNTAFQAMQDTAKGTTAIFGGDLNLRDKELAQLGGPPKGVLDLWEVTGRRENARYTWDRTLNDNLDMPCFTARCRFDRLYIRHSSPSRTLNPVYFDLVGLKRIPSCGRFASDHWGMMVHFDKAT